MKPQLPQNNKKCVKLSYAKLSSPVCLLEKCFIYGVTYQLHLCELQQKCLVFKNIYIGQTLPQKKNNKTCLPTHEKPTLF